MLPKEGACKNSYAWLDVSFILTRISIIFQEVAQQSVWIVIQHATSPAFLQIMYVYAYMYTTVSGETCSAVKYSVT
jgi:hypothetical protein